MEPALLVTLLWLLFGGTHIGLATTRIRGALVGRLGDIGFNALFSLVAAASFALLIGTYAAHRSEGAAGLALGDWPGLRGMLMGVIVVGVALSTAALISYPRSPYTLFAGTTIRSPYGIERVTRHPFFAGVALLALAHVLLATRLVGTVFAAGLTLVAIAGAWHQDGKFLARQGRPYADYLAVTSAVPFAAILSGRQRLVVRELPLGTLVLGLAIALLLRAVHDSIFAHGGVFVIGAVIGGAAVETVQSWRRARRVGAVSAVADRMGA